MHLRVNLQTHGVTSVNADLLRLPNPRRYLATRTRVAAPPGWVARGVHASYASYTGTVFNAALVTEAEGGEVRDHTTRPTRPVYRPSVHL